MNLPEALAEVSKWGNVMRAFAKVQDVLEQANVQENLKAERTKALEDISSQLSAMKAEFEKAKAEAPVVVDTAKQTAAKLIADARQAAAKIVEDARKAEEGAKAAVQAALAEREKHEALVAEARTDLESAKAQAASVRAQIADALAAARQRFGA